MIDPRRRAASRADLSRVAVAAGSMPGRRENGRMADHPITVAIERRIGADHAAEATNWMQEGTDLAKRFPGFLGSGWVRGGEDSDIWYMLYRFRDIDTLESWERSAERREWLESASSFAHQLRSERRTGIEGWFDAPLADSVHTSTSVSEPAPPSPPRWKQAVTIWLGFFPVNLVGTWLLLFVPTFAEWPLYARIALSTLIFTPIMTYWMLPFVTRLLRPWLQRPRRERMAR